jgi:hypothetical protein
MATAAALKEPSGSLFCKQPGCLKHKSDPKIKALVAAHARGASRLAKGRQAVGVFKNAYHFCHHVATAHPGVDFRETAAQIAKHDEGTLKELGAYAPGLDAEAVGLYATLDWPNSLDRDTWEHHMASHKDMTVCNTCLKGDYGSLPPPKKGEQAPLPNQDPNIKNPLKNFLVEGGTLIAFYDYKGDEEPLVYAHRRGFGNKSKAFHPVQRHSHSDKPRKRPVTAGVSVTMGDIYASWRDESDATFKPSAPVLAPEFLEAEKFQHFIAYLKTKAPALASVRMVVC